MAHGCPARAVSASAPSCPLPKAPPASCIGVLPPDPLQLFLSSLPFCPSQDPPCWRRGCLRPLKSSRLWIRGIQTGEADCLRPCGCQCQDPGFTPAAGGGRLILHTSVYAPCLGNCPFSAGIYICLLNGRPSDCGQPDICMETSSSWGLGEEG